jgi:hypothetical protein
VHFHWQNLKESERGVLLHGRAWLHFGPSRTLSWSWRLGLRSGWRAEVDVGGDENDVRGSLALGVLAFYAGIAGFLPYTALARRWGRTTGVSLFEDHLVVRLHCDDSTTYHSNGRMRSEHGWYRSWFLKDVILGRATHTSRVLAEGVPVAVQMPELTYFGTARLTEDTWSRPRWRPLRTRRTHIDMPRGVPLPGKGENAWDCDEDACFGQTGPHDNVADAVAALVEYVEGRRLRYGGEGWRPAASVAAA